MKLTARIKSVPKMTANFKELKMPLSGGFEEGYKQGARAEYDRFWDAYQEYGKRTDYVGAFMRGWTDDVFNPKYDITASYAASQIFQYTDITNLKDKLDKLGVKLDFSNCVYMTQAFQGAKITHIPEIDIRNVIECGYAFGSGCKVVTIDKLIVSETTAFVYSTFQTANWLTNINFEGNIGVSIDLHWSPLTKDSLVSLANALSPTSTATLTVSKTAVNAAFPNQAEWDALFENKPNWTISEV